MNIFTYRILCTLPAIYMYSLLPSLTSLYSHPSVKKVISLPSNKHDVSLILFHTHWLFARCFIYKMPPAMRPFVFECIWTISQLFQFRWLSISLSSSEKDEEKGSIPAKEAVFSNYKLIYMMMKMATIEVRVQLDYLYKDVVSIYEEGRQ